MDHESAIKYHCYYNIIISEKTLIKHFTAVINAVWISISDQVEFLEIQSDPGPVLNSRIRFDREPGTGSCSTLQTRDI